MKSTNVLQRIGRLLLFNIPSSNFIPKSLVLDFELLINEDISWFSNNYILVSKCKRNGRTEFFLMGVFLNTVGGMSWTVDFVFFVFFKLNSKVYTCSWMGKNEIMMI